MEPVERTMPKLAAAIGAEAEVGIEAGLHQRRQVVALVEIPAERLALRGAEDVAVGARVAPDVLAEHLAQRTRKGQRSGLAGLGRLNVQMAIDLGQRLFDLDCALQEVLARYAQSCEFTPAHPGVSRAEDERAIAGLDGIRKSLDLS